MELLHNEASLLLNSLCFRPLKVAKYGFSFKHSERKVVYIPIKVKSPSPASENQTSNNNNNDNDNESNSNASYYYVPCMLIQGKNLSTIPPNEREVPIAKNIILHFHGTSGDIEKSHLWAALRKSLPEFDILCVEFPGGYGTASSRFPSSSSSNFEPFFCSRESLIEVSRGVTDFLIQRAGIAEENIIFAGRSIGTGIATELAARYYPRCAALLLLSPYASLSAVIRGVVEKKIPTNVFFVRHLVSFWISQLLRFLCSFGRTSLFEPKDHIEQLDCPTWIAHGRKDPLIPIAHAEQLVSRIQLSDCTSPSRRNNNNNNNSNAAESSSTASSSKKRSGSINNNNENKFIHLHVDPEGTHTDFEFSDAMAKFLNDLVASKKGQLQETTRTKCWSSVPFANAQTIQQLREDFKTDAVAAAKFKTRCARAVAVTAIVTTACAVALSTLLWKYFVRPKLLKW